MKKIRLELEALSVETFAATTDDGAGRGTVHGRDSAGSGIGCVSLGCDSASGLEQCICENNFNPSAFSCAC